MNTPLHVPPLRYHLLGCPTATFSCTSEQPFLPALSTNTLLDVVMSGDIGLFHASVSTNEFSVNTSHSKK
jgi:hypothetical protein